MIRLQRDGCVREPRGNCARVCSMAFRMAMARNATSVGETIGLATVSMSAAVSPKLLLNWMGPAPRGSREFSWFSFRLMSLNSFDLSFTLSANWM